MKDKLSLIYNHIKSYLSMKSKNLTTLLVVIYILIICTLIYFSELGANVFKDIALITTSFATLTIALLLYDRFNYRKIVFERKLEIVLKLLEYLKNIRIGVVYNNTEKEIMFMGAISVDRDEISKFLSVNHFNNSSKVVFDAVEILENYQLEIMKFKTNLYMPKEIVEKLRFLIMNSFEGVENNVDYQNEYVKISINIKSKNNFNGLKDWCRADEKDITFQTFIKSYLDTFDEIENWINKHSSIKTELNL